MFQEVIQQKQHQSGRFWFHASYKTALTAAVTLLLATFRFECLGGPIKIKQKIHNKVKNFNVSYLGPKLYGNQ